MTDIVNTIAAESAAAERRQPKPDTVTLTATGYRNQPLEYTMTAPVDGMTVVDAERYAPLTVIYQERPGALIREAIYHVYGHRGARDYFDYAQYLHVLAVPADIDAFDYYQKRVVKCFHDNPWMQFEWFRNAVSVWVEHLPQASETVPGNVAYFQSVEKRARDIQTPIKPGRYLKKFFGHLLSEEQIHEAALVWQNHFALRKLHVTQDADEIERVYRGRYNGSCMHFGRGEYSGDMHPARVYAGPDLGIAYIGDMDDAEARCLVWPEKKIYYPKWYGDGPRLEAALLAEGYRSASASEFYGARIQRHKYGNTFVVPYVDVCDYLDDDGDHLIIGGCEVYCRNTNGLSQEMPICDECGEEAADDYLTYARSSGGWMEIRVCDCCLEEHYFYCEVMEEYTHNDNRENVAGDTAVSRRGVTRHPNLFFYCDHTERYYLRSEYDEVSLVEGGNCEQGYAEEHGFYCAYLEEWSLETDQKLTLTNGDTIHRSATEAYDFDEWCEGRDTALGTIPDANQLDMLEAA